MASGLPVLASDWGGYRDSVVDDVTGYRVPTFITRGGPRVAWRRATEPLERLGRDSRLRQRLARPDLIRTVRGQGYQFVNR